MPTQTSNTRATKAIEKQPKSADVPLDVTAALGKRKALKQYFQRLAPSHQKEYLQWIESAKKPQTRVSRIEKMMVTLGEKFSGGKE